MVEIPPGTKQSIVVFNQATNIGEVHYFDSEGKEIGYRHFTIKEGKEVFIDPPPNEERICFFIPPTNLDNSKAAHIIDLTSGNNLPNALPLKRIEVGENEFLSYVYDEKLESRLSLLSKEEQKYLYERLSEGSRQIITLQGDHQIQIQLKDIDSCGLAKKPLTVYRNIERQSEIGICQLIADQMYHLADLLNGCEIQRERKGSQFYIKASKEVANGELRFTYPFTAPDIDSARKLAQEIQERLLGLGKKMWLACWTIGNDLNQQTFSVPLNKIMAASFPARKSKFSDDERREFLEELKLLRIPQFTLIRRSKTKGKVVESKCHISILQIVAEKGEQSYSPSDIMVNLLSIAPIPLKNEKRQFVGVPVKRNTLIAGSRETNFELFLQTRKHQDRARKKNPPKFYDFRRSQLILEAGYQGTEVKNPRMANKRLKNRLEECRKKQQLSSYPDKIGEIVRIFW
jgi:hypothetical protein